MKSKPLLRLLIFTLLPLLFQTCAKGPEDDFISLKSRTKRMVGEFNTPGVATMTRYTTNSTGVNIDTTYWYGSYVCHGDKYDWDRKFMTLTEPKTNLSFKKDGSWSRTVNFTENGEYCCPVVKIGTYKMEQTGTWVWNKKVDGYKKKESLTVTIASSKETFTTTSGVSTVYNHTFTEGSTELWHLLYLGSNQFRAEIKQVNTMMFTDGAYTVKTLVDYGEKVTFNRD